MAGDTAIDPPPPADPGASTPVGALVLAAGFSHRFGSLKLCAPLPDGGTVFSRTLAALGAAIPDICIVTRPEVAPQLPPVSAEIILFDDAERGMGASLAHGVQTLMAQRSWRAVLVCLADMPYITTATYAQLAQAADADHIVVPEYAGRPGNPVAFGRRFFQDLSTLTGDQGGRPVLRAHPDAVRRVAVSDAAILRDIDTPEDLRAGTAGA